MAFHLVSRPLPLTIPTNQTNRVIYAKVLTGKPTIVIVITDANEMVGYGFESGMEICRFELSYSG